MIRASLVLALVLAACGGESPVMTEGDVINEVSVAFCARLDECADLGGFEGQVDLEYCEAHNNVHLCRGRDCEGPTTDDKIDDMYACVEDMETTDCNAILFLGAVPVSCDPLL